MNEHSIFMHEIKNSLSNIYSLVELIETSKDELDSYLPLIKASINQIKNIEFDYDEFRKSGKNTIRLSLVNVSTMIISIVDEYKSATVSQHISIKTSGKSIKVLTDATKLRQVLTNLISNAIKYNKQRGQILIEYKVVRDNVHICISDSGIGMNLDEIRMLGTMFYRSKKIDVPGTGLGWPLIKNIVSIMGWDISIKSNLGQSEYNTMITLII